MVYAIVLCVSVRLSQVDVKNRIMQAMHNGRAGTLSLSDAKDISVIPVAVTAVRDAKYMLDRKKL